MLLKPLKISGTVRAELIEVFSNLPAFVTAFDGSTWSKGHI